MRLKSMIELTSRFFVFDPKNLLERFDNSELPPPLVVAV
jgi:hypothetical protein